MNVLGVTALDELSAVFADLGTGGGRISPSIYDTAQSLRLYPQKNTALDIVEWLVAQQEADGGWGDPTVPLSRDMPTLAAILALHDYTEDCRVRKAINAGLTFLQNQTDHWVEEDVDSLPMAAEVIIPYLIDIAAEQGFAISKKPYTYIYQAQIQKKQLLQAKPFRPGSPATYSWEAFDRDAYSIQPDYSGGIGHSPAATAAWLQQAEQHADLADQCELARHYLTNAALATGTGIPGVVPTAWPITGFELSYGSYILLATSLLHLSELQHLVKPLIDELWIVFQRGHGVSFGEYFAPEADDTGLAMSVLCANGREVDLAAVLQFQHGDHFCMFRHELNPSVIVNAHVLYGLAHAGERSLPTEEFLRSRQQDDGHWLADKVHSSWLYTTLEVAIVLNHLGYTAEMQRVVHALVKHQKPNGGWGQGNHGTRLETSYALITLAIIRQSDLLTEEGKRALQRGYQWLQASESQTQIDERLWIGKELYASYRVDQLYTLCAMLVATPERVLQ